MKKKTFKGLYKIWNKIISFDIRNKGEMEDRSWEKCKKKKIGNPWNESLRFKCGTPIMLAPNNTILSNDD